MWARHYGKCSDEQLAWFVRTVEVDLAPAYCQKISYNAMVIIGVVCGYLHRVSSAADY